MKKAIHLSGVLGLFALGASSSVMADPPEWYAGLSAGRSAATIDDGRIESGLIGDGLTTSSIANRDRSSGYKIFGGYQINPFVAVEGGYFDLGKFGFTANTVPLGTLSGDMRVQGLNLDLVGKLPITSKLSVLARAGLNYANTRDSFSGTGAVMVNNPNPNKHDTNYKLGLGLGYDFNESWGMRVEAERYRVSDAVGNKGHIDLVTVGLVYRFGGAPAPVVARAAPVAVVAAAEPPPPAVVPPPAATPAPVVRVPVRVTLSADSTFGFDSAELKPDGIAQLDQLVSDLRGTDYTLIRVTGHTDRIGSHAYNMKLSTRRAEAVSAYLVGSMDIPAGRISATGVDGEEPVTQPEDCKGKTATKALIACLQPDRRVEVEVDATSK